MKRVLALALAAILLLSGCTAALPEGTQTEKTETEKRGNSVGEYIDVKRAEAALPLTEQGKTGGNDFSVRLFQAALKEADTNALVSPLSAFIALSMAANGAKDETLSEFESVLGLPLDSLNETAKALFNNLTMTEGSTELQIANSVWTDETCSPEESFLKIMNEGYFAELYVTRLSHSKDAVNAWVSHHTNGLIKELLSEEPAENTKLLLMNALYFNAKWEQPFADYSTYAQEFTTAEGETVSAEFLHAELWGASYLDTDSAEGIVLPYDDTKTVFLALKPKSGTARELAGTLTGNSLSGYLESAEEADIVALSLPKFDLETTLKLETALKAMGLTAAFDPEADFTGISEGLYLDSVLQKTRIRVDEEGTEAAAVTEVAVVGRGMLNPNPVLLTFNTPFLYAVVDTQSGMPLFLGILENPNA